jgi:glutathione S-transferase
MVLDWKGISHEVSGTSPDAMEGVVSPRAEVPVLIDGDLHVVNSADILGYLDRKFPESTIYPRDPKDFALTREWERTADTLIDAIVTDVAIYSWADLPPAPEGLIEAARANLVEIYTDLEALLADRAFITGELGVADFALYPHLMAARTLGIGPDGGQHPLLTEWIRRLRLTVPGQIDLGHVRAWWANRASQSVDTKRVNWGTHRLEWFLAHGFHDRFVEEVRADRVLWSVGPNRNGGHRLGQVRVKPCVR